MMMSTTAMEIEKSTMITIEMKIMEIILSRRSKTTMMGNGCESRIWSEDRVPCERLQPLLLSGINNAVRVYLVDNRQLW